MVYVLQYHTTRVYCEVHYRVRYGIYNITSPSQHQIPTDMSTNTPQQHNIKTSASLHTSGGRGGDGDNSSSDDSSISSRSSASSYRYRRSTKSRRSKKKNRKAKSKKHKSYFYDSDSDSDDDDRKYRKLVKILYKSIKAYKPKELSMHSHPIIRKEKFSTWIIDLRNILSTHKRTSGLLDEYPLKLDKFDPNVDRIIKTILFSLTSGSTKRLISSIPTAHEALLDIKRNFGQTSTIDIHRERKNMMNLRQGFNETASEFLRRIRKQMDICATGGCYDFHVSSGSQTLVNIALQGMVKDNKHYAADLAEMKAKFRNDPTSISLKYMEEIFFNIDDELNQHGHRKKESARNFMEILENTITLIQNIKIIRRNIAQLKKLNASNVVKKVIMPTNVPTNKKLTRS